MRITKRGPPHSGRYLKREVSRDYVLKLVLKYLEVRYLALMKGGGNLRKDYFDMLHGYRETLPALYRWPKGLSHYYRCSGRWSISGQYKWRSQEVYV